MPARLAFIGSVLALASMVTGCASQQLKATTDTPATSARGGQPIKALFVGGGDAHDYSVLIPLLTTRLSKTINVHFDIDPTRAVLKTADFAKPYDIVVYDVCQGDGDSTDIEHILAATRAGMPAVVIHCSVHSFQGSPLRPTWVKFIGIDSRHHDTFEPFKTMKLEPSNPITLPFPADWTTPGDELYQTEEIVPGTTALLSVKSPEDGRVHTVAWTHMFGNARVFGTTLGHDTTTAQMPEYIRLVANGMLWATGHLQDNGTPAPGYAAP